MTPTALVTGATGFLGQHLVRHLATLGYDLHVLHRAGSERPQLRTLEGLGASIHLYAVHDELREIVGSIAPDYVFHLATHYLKDHRPEDVGPLLEANVTLGTHLLEALVGSEAVVVSAMSYFQFLHNSPQPMSLYSATKQAFLDIADFYRTSRQLDIRQVVLFDTFGPEDTRDKLIPRLVAAVGDGSLVGMGSPRQELNLLFCDDVAAGFVAASVFGAPAMMALKAPVNHSVGEIVATVEDVAARQLNKSFNEAGVFNDLVNASGSWPPPPGWRAEVSLREGLARILGGSVRR